MFSPETSREVNTMPALAQEGWPSARLFQMEQQGDLSPLVMHTVPQWRFCNREALGCPQGRTHS